MKLSLALLFAAATAITLRCENGCDPLEQEMGSDPLEQDVGPDPQVDDY